MATDFVVRAALVFEKIVSDILLRGCDVRYVECRTVVLYTIRHDQLVRISTPIPFVTQILDHVAGSHSSALFSCVRATVLAFIFISREEFIQHFAFCFSRR